MYQLIEQDNDTEIARSDKFVKPNGSKWLIALDDALCLHILSRPAIDNYFTDIGGYDPGMYGMPEFVTDKEPGLYIVTMGFAVDCDGEFEFYPQTWVKLLQLPDLGSYNKVG